MADALAVPGNENYGEWTYEQVLLALTDEGSDLHTLADGPWYTVPEDLSKGGDLNYHAWGESFMSVNFNKDSAANWEAAWQTMNEIVGDVSRGRRGSMDVQTLKDLAVAINSMAIWSQWTGAGFHYWSNALDRDDSDFKGKAAALIQFRMKAGGDGLVDIFQQLTTRHNVSDYATVNALVTGLEAFNTSMSNTWSAADVRNIVANTINAETTKVFNYLQENGLFLGTSNYRLNDYFFNVNAGKDYIRSVMAAYSTGALNTQAGWDAISREVAQQVKDYLKTNIDTPAGTALTTLAPLYLTATSALVDIAKPPVETPPHITTDPPGANPPPDGGGDGNIPPPGGGGDMPPPGGGGGGGDMPPPGGDGGGGDMPPPGGGGGGGDMPPGGDGTGNNALLGGGGSGDGGIDPPGGGGDVNAPGGGGTDGSGGGDPALGGGGGVIPGFVPPGGDPGGGVLGGGSGVGPGGDGSFNEPGGGDGTVKPPGGADGSGNTNLPPGAGNSKTKLPPGGMPSANDGGGGTGIPGGGAGGGAGAGAGAGHGFGKIPGGGGGAGGAGSGAGGGAGGGGDGAGLTGSPMRATGGSPGMDGTPGSSGGAGSSGEGGGGVPFYPPMMGGGGMGGAGGDRPQERERQTWLSEDEEIWGTRVDVGSGVIGRLDEDDFETDEAPLVGPVRGQRRADTPRRRPSAEERPETEATGEEAAGSGTAS